MLTVFFSFAQYDEKCFYDSMTYLHMPSRLSQMANHANSSSDRLVRNSKDTFYIKTIVCSTKLTQNGETSFSLFLYANSFWGNVLSSPSKQFDECGVCFLLVNVFIVDLVGLLRWKSQKRQIPSVLTSLLKIDGEEIVKVSEFVFYFGK